MVKREKLIKNTGTELPIWEKIRSARAARGMTQHQLAVATGMTVTAISGLENGRRPTPRLDTIQRLSKALDINLIEMGPKDKPEITTEYIKKSLSSFLKSPMAKSLRLSAKERSELAELKWFNPHEKPTHMDWADWIRLRRRVRAINGG